MLLAVVSAMLVQWRKPLRLMADSDELQVGEPVRLRHRGGGGRVVVDVSAVRPGPIRVEAERVDDPPPGRQALPRRYGGR